MLDTGAVVARHDEKARETEQAWNRFGFAQINILSSKSSLIIIILIIIIIIIVLFVLC